jgi:hypothetical protein
MAHKVNILLTLSLLFLPTSHICHQLTLNHSEIYCLSAVNFDPPTTELICIRVIIYPQYLQRSLFYSLPSLGLYHIRLFSFCLDKPTHKRTAVQVFRFHHSNKILAYLFLTSQSHYWPLIDKVGLISLMICFKSYFSLQVGWAFSWATTSSTCLIGWRRSPGTLSRTEW